MIKTVNINLGGIVFQIDEDAFETLRKYLDSLTQYYKYTEGRDEIVSDIESRLAEIFGESLHQSGFNVISMGDVEEVIEIMGRPEDFDVDSDLFEEETKTNASNKTYTNTSKGKATRRLYKNPDDAIIAGVSSGLSAYFGIEDPLWIRLTFIILTVLSVGMAPIVYLILWIILPKAETTAQKLEMSGERVNINNMEKKIREEISQVGENLKGFANSNPHNSGLRSIVNGIGKLFGAIAKLFFLCFKIIFGFIAVCLVISGFVALIATLFSFLVLIPLSIKYIFASTFGWLIALIGGILTFGIPILFIIYLPFLIFTQYRIRTKNVGFVAIGLFLMGAILMAISSAEVASYFSERESVTTESTLEHPYGDTLYVSLNDNEEEFSRLEYDLKFSNIFSFTKRLETASDFVELDILPSSDGTIYLEKTYRSSGRTDNKARKYAESISHNVKYDAETITIDPYFGLGKRNKWRNQEVKLTLSVPEGMVVAFDNDLSNILDNVDNSKNVGVNTVAGNRWRMNDGVMEPVDSVLTMGSSWSKKNMQYFDYGNFDKIELVGNVEATIVQADDYEVYMELNKYYLNDVEVEKNGSTIEISYKERDWKWNDVSIGFMRSRVFKRPQFYIATPNLEYLKVSGLSHAVIDGLEQENFTAVLTGQGSFYFDNINIANLTTDLSGQSELSISGVVDKYIHDGDGQSNVDGEALTANKLFIDLSGQSDSELRVEERIDAELSGQSDFEYWGDPIVQKSVSGQADMDQRD